jgi:type II secretory pathway pseudopilin PulG
MALPNQPPSRTWLSRLWNALKSLLSTLAAMLAVGIGLSSLSDFWSSASLLTKTVVIAVVTVLLAAIVTASVRSILKHLKEERSKAASKQVADALDVLKGQTPLAEISNQTIAEQIKGSKISKDQLARLVEQHKQQLLIDDEYFRDELRTLIIDYLQPLPRNAKRLLNRFRVNLLVAHSRGLLTSDPKVTAQQIGKWLVLVERWPQLGRSLSAAPDKIRVMEDHSLKLPTLAQPSQSDLFMDTVKLLSPFYADDEDLRKFIHSEPLLAPVLVRLVHYGEAQPPTPTAT